MAHIWSDFHQFNIHFIDIKDGAFRLSHRNLSAWEFVSAFGFIATQSAAVSKSFAFALAVHAAHLIVAMAP